MDRFKARPLRTLSLTSRPLSPHALSWSCDAELAVATAECVYIFLPEFMPDPRGGGGGDDNSEDYSQQQFSLCLQPSAIVQPNRDINARLCAQAGVKFPEDDEVRGFRGVGSGIIAGSGSALGQVVRVEWSPNGLGCNLRPILTELTTNGSVIALGEHIDPRSRGSSSSMRTRGFKNWKVLWGLGAKLPLPDEDYEDGYRSMDERITSFSWAKEIFPGRALLAYATDAGEIIVMSVQHYSPRRESEAAAAAASEDEYIWNVMELDRFDGQGPHGPVNPTDPDFVPHGSIFSLKWSPWLVRDGYRIATLAYLARNYVGFRRVTIYDTWEKGEVPKTVVEEGDTTGTCVFLSSDAFVEWEDAIWPERDDAFVARGVIATPFVVKPFEIVLNGILKEAMQPHSTSQCSSTYPPETEPSTNPITGLVVHTPDPNHKPQVPYYTAVRLSATHTNIDWFETNLPAQLSPLPQWATDLASQTARLVPRAAALQGTVDSDSDSDSHSDSDTNSDAQGSKIAAGEPSRRQVHPLRYRTWGLASSPGGGCTALLASKHSTQHPARRGLATLLFDWHVPAEDEEPALRSTTATTALTTEGKMWEWMYSMGQDVPGVTTTAAAAKPPPPSGRRTTAAADGGHARAMRELFRDIAGTLPCVFCDANISTTGETATCQNGHTFATCAASGIPIMAPGISRVCGVCKLRCLEVSELRRLAQQHMGSSDGVVAASGQVCGGCGGKFVE